MEAQSPKSEQADRAPSLKTLVALASGLEVPLLQLFNFAGRKISSPRTEVELLRLRGLLADAPDSDVKLLNLMAERLAAGRVRAPRKKSATKKR